MSPELDMEALGLFRHRWGEIHDRLALLAVTARGSGAPFLETISWPFYVTLFEHQGETIGIFHRIGQQYIKTSLPFMKVLSWLL